MASIYGRGLSGLLKRGLHEIPAIMYSTTLGVIGVGFVLYDMYAYGKEPIKKKYKNYYMVVRPDDPRVNEVTRSYPW